MADTKQVKKNDQGNSRELSEDLVAEAKKALPSTSPSEMSSTDNDRGSTGRVNTESSDVRPFAEHVILYVTEHIKLADQKAAFIFTIASALLCYLYTKDIHKMWISKPSDWSGSDLLAILAMLALGTGLLCACFVVLPSLSKSHRGIVFFKSINEFESASAYASEIIARQTQDLDRMLLKQAYDMSHICSRKYCLLSVAMWTTFIGILLTIILLLFTS